MTDQPRHYNPVSRLLLTAAVLLVAMGGGDALAGAKLPSISFVYPAGGQQGATIEVTISGVSLKGATAVRITGDGVTGEVLPPKEVEPPEGAAKKKRKAKTSEEREEETIRVSLTISSGAPSGRRELRVVTAGGVSNRYRFIVGQTRQLVEQEPNSKKDQAQALGALPAVVNGQIFSADRDLYRFQAKAGQTIVCEVKAQSLLPFIPDAVPGWLQATLTLYDAQGKELAYVDDFRFKPDPVLIYKMPKDGEYLIEVKDAVYRGRGDFVYRLRVGALPFITHIYPLGAPRKSTAQVQLTGANLTKQSLSVPLAGGSPMLQYIDVTCGGIKSNALPFSAGDVKETNETEPNDAPGKASKVAAPVTINGRIQRPGDVDYFALKAEAKQELVIEVHARRLDSPLDSIVTVSNAKGREVARNDDVTDESRPLVTHHADSRLVYTFPAAGDYVISLRDVQGKGGEEYAYRLSITPPRPDFALRVLPDNPRISPGATVALTAVALRRDGFDGEIKLTLKDLPEGFVVRGAGIPAKESEVRFTITAPPAAPIGLLSPSLVGTSKIAGKVVFRKAIPAEEVQQAFSYWHRVPTEEFLLAVTKSKSLALSTDLPPEKVLEIPQNGSAEFVVKVAREKGMKGQIRLKADKPPKGITVRAAPIPGPKSEAKITVRVTRQARVGLAQNIVLTGTMKMGKETIAGVTPAVRIKVVAASPTKK